MRWYVGPWQWLSSPWPSWNPPSGFSGLDTRILPAQSQAGGSPGVGVFFGDGPNPGSDYTLIGSGSWLDIKPAGRVLAAIPRRKNFTPTGDTLRSLLLSVFTDGADPDGFDGPRPILPTTLLRIELCAGEVHSLPFVWGQGHTGLIRDVLRKDFAAVMGEAIAGRTTDPQIHRRALDFWQKKYGVADWREFVPLALRSDVPGPLPHKTTITDDFNRSNGSLGTAAGGWSWNAVSGTWAITSNTAGKSATDSTPQLARAESDLSSADQRCQIRRVDNNGLTFQGPTCRFNPSAATCYWIANFTGALYIGKIVAGTQTNFTAIACSLNANDVYKLTVEGSTLTSHNNGTGLQSTSDTSITGNLRCGMLLYSAVAQAIDDFEAADLVSFEDGYGVAAGIAAAGGDGSSLFDGYGSAVGVASIAGVVDALADGLASSAGVGSASGRGDSLADGSGASSGIAGAAGVVDGLTDGLGTAAGTSAGSGDGAATADGEGQSAALAVVAGEGSTLIDGSGAAAGVAVVVGYLVDVAAAVPVRRFNITGRGSVGFSIAGRASAAFDVAGRGSSRFTVQGVEAVA